jgi:hypothetical protein
MVADALVLVVVVVAAAVVVVVVVALSHAACIRHPAAAAFVKVLNKPLPAPYIEDPYETKQLLAKKEFQVSGAAVRGGCCAAHGVVGKSRGGRNT